MQIGFGEAERWLMIVIGIFLLVVTIISILMKRNNNGNHQNRAVKIIKKNNKYVDIWNMLEDWKKNLIECVLVGLLAYFIFTNIFLHGVIPSGSMEPTLKVGDMVLINALAYIKKNPQRGDIVILKAEDTGENILIKRVIGIPGDSLVFVDGFLYINGELVDEEYLPSDMQTNSFKDFDEIPENCYFVMGDNRLASFDSRSWNNPYVPKENIKGKMICNIPLSQLRQAGRNT